MQVTDNGHGGNRHGASPHNHADTKTKPEEPGLKKPSRHHFSTAARSGGCDKHQPIRRKKIMSRSVATHSGACARYFIDTSDTDCPEDWAILIECLVYRLHKKLPSLSPADGWEERECRKVAENRHVSLFIAEYCGLASVSVVPNDAEHSGISRAWFDQVERKINGALVDTFGAKNLLRKIGSASNGEAFFERCS
jgi:hypothetical protein